MKKIQILFDRSKCMKCNSCLSACTVEHSASKSIFAAILEKPAPFPRLKLERIHGNHFEIIKCDHCDDGYCIASCPSDAIYRDEYGYVQINTSKCNGCGLCSRMCKKIIIINSAAYKCDGCLDKLKNGSHPACVNACHTRALYI
ncbi:MAG: 4Fe-4S dicluster domain-containing protein [Spirochaetes bacterium]|nr:4Fe-4S dicluster domain-containing protein [Spirochaetota bacterium]